MALQRTGTKLHDSAASHCHQLSGALSKYDVSSSELNRFFNKEYERVPVANVVHADPIRTRVVNTVLDKDQLCRMSRELRARSKIVEALRSLSIGSYSPISLEFENSVLFLPSAYRFYKENKALVNRLYPEIDTIVVNAFYIPAGKRPYGCHNAGSIAFQRPDFCNRGHGYPMRHISFHTAVTPTPLDRQPLVVFDDANVESPSTGYLFRRLMDYSLQPKEESDIKRALYVLESGKSSEMDIVSLRDFLLCKYWEKYYAHHSDLADGYFAELRPGQAIVFDNYRPHADSTLPVSCKDRITIDMRCFSRVSYPAESIRSGLDLYSFSVKKKLEQKKLLLNCLLALLGYENTDEFMEMIYGGRARDINPFEILTDLQFGIYNKNSDYLLDQDLSHHYERVLAIYDRIERSGEFSVPHAVQEILSKQLG